MVFDFFEHKADVGIKGRGESLEEAFAEGAKAMFSLMAEIESVEPRERIEVKANAGDLGGLFVSWLNELLFLKDSKHLLFSEFEVKEIRGNRGFSLHGFALGERIDFEKHKPKTEVKAATYSQLKVEEKNGKFLVQCVVDV